MRVSTSGAYASGLSAMQRLQAVDYQYVDYIYEFSSYIYIYMGSSTPEAGTIQMELPIQNRNEHSGGWAMRDALHYCLFITPRPTWL